MSEVINSEGCQFEFIVNVDNRHEKLSAISFNKMKGSIFQNFKNEVSYEKRDSLKSLKKFKIDMLPSEKEKFIFKVGCDDEDKNYMEAVYSLVNLVCSVHKVSKPKKVHVSMFNLVKEDFVTPISSQMIQNNTKAAKKNKI